MTPRLRFAPSPTGPVHIGNVHTAVFSWVLARAWKGDFILRIEDTDEARNTPEATQLLFDALTWIGIDWDEGPDVGGDYAPYVQSERRHFHQQAIAQLLAGDHAYYSHDPDSPVTSEDRPLRLRMPRTGKTIVQDAIHGPIELDNARYDDPVIVRSSGQPLYHLAAIVDDHDMGITHVVRGEEFISSTPIHMQLYKALGWTEPVWIHLPLILNMQGQKLKKRDPEGGYLIQDFQAAGYLPQAVFNYLLLLGWMPDNDQEILDKWEVRQQFRLQRLSLKPPTFDWDKLNWVNRQYILKLSAPQLAALLRPFLEDAYGELPVAHDWLVRLTAVLRDRLSKLEDAIELAEWAFIDELNYSQSAREALQTPSARPVLTRLVAELAAIVLLDEQTADSILKSLRQTFQQSEGWGAAKIFHPVRAALTGNTDGPPLPGVMSIIGKARCLQRISHALKISVQ
jgi:glutamyl-tRNA synthetase